MSLQFGAETSTDHFDTKPDETKMFSHEFQMLHEKRYEEVSPSCLYFFKRSNKSLSPEMKTAVDECILELTKVQPQSVLRNMRLTIQPDLNSDERAIISSGSQTNRLLAFRALSETKEDKEVNKLELVWYREGPETKEASAVTKVLPYILFTLFLLGIYGFLLEFFILHDFKVRAQAEGVLTVRAYTADLHHDRLNEFYKLPMQNSDGGITYPYKGD
ncbi:uncharacterized protein LOC134848263 [Symsagittifera roscoffensis]|uniref:uncharacterized protein LOC134848263 n=1 Tax=Symsagittifera roscoffensis TaxID=84072 RepID=UPI00307C959C